MVLIIGDTPSKWTDPFIAFKGAKCETRLQQWISRILDDGETYLLINRVTEGFTEYLLLAEIQRVPIIALGNKASEALKAKPHFKLPHPSGLNRQINNKKFIDEKLAACYSYIHLGDYSERRT